MLSRRHFLGASLATTVYAAGSFVPVWAQNAPNFGTPTLPSPGFKRMKVGDVEVIALNDGITRRPLGEEFVKNAPLAEVRALLASQNLPTDYIDVPYTPFLVVAGARKILIDTGLGEFGGPTTGKLLDSLRAAGMQASDIDLWELNEAFATVVLTMMEELDIPHERMNVNGGAIAMGHPLGATGAMILGTVLDELERTGKRTALISLCVAAGMGSAMIIERV